MTSHQNKQACRFTRDNQTLKKILLCRNIRDCLSVDILTAFNKQFLLYRRFSAPCNIIVVITGNESTFHTLRKCLLTKSTTLKSHILKHFKSSTLCRNLIGQSKSMHFQITRTNFSSCTVFFPFWHHKKCRLIGQNSAVFCRKYGIFTPTILLTLVRRN